MECRNQLFQVCKLLLLARKLSLLLFHDLVLPGDLGMLACDLRLLFFDGIDEHDIEAVIHHLFDFPCWLCVTSSGTALAVKTALNTRPGQPLDVPLLFLQIHFDLKAILPCPVFTAPSSPAPTRQRCCCLPVMSLAIV